MNELMKCIKTEKFAARELSALLRDRSKWPEGFVWDNSTTRGMQILLA